MQDTGLITDIQDITLGKVQKHPEGPEGTFFAWPLAAHV